MIRSAWRMWKRFRWKNLVRVWAVFMAIALVLLAQTLGIHYGATKFRPRTPSWGSAPRT